MSYFILAFKNRMLLFMRCIVSPHAALFTVTVNSCCLLTPTGELNELTGSISASLTFFSAGITQKSWSASAKSFFVVLPGRCVMSTEPFGYGGRLRVCSPEADNKSQSVNEMLVGIVSDRTSVI